MHCCAMAQISMNESDTLEDIKMVVRKATKDRNKTWNYLNRDSGETMLMVTVSPHETKLPANLLLAGFELTKSFPRRKGYPAEGDIKLYTIILPLN